MPTAGNDGFAPADVAACQDLLTFMARESNATIWQVDLESMRGFPLSKYPFLGFSLEEIPNTLDAWLTLVHPSDLGTAHGQVAEFIEGNRERLELEHRARHRDGGWRWLRTSATIQKRSPDGKPTVMQGVCVEITHTRHSERLLKMSRTALAQFGRATSLEELLEGLVQATQQQTDDSLAAVLLREPESKTLHLAAGSDVPLALRASLQNQTNCMCSGPCVASLTGLDSFVGNIQESPWCDSCRGAAADAGLASCATAALTDSQGVNLGVFVMFSQQPRTASREEHELLQAAAQLASIGIDHWRNLSLLRRSEERLERALWGADLGLWDADLSTGNAYFSDHWNRMLGYAPGEFPTRIDSLLSIVHPEDQQTLIKAWQEHAEGRTSYFESEHRLQAKDGRWIWVCDRARIIARDDQGKPSRAAGTQYEISQRKNIELELRRSEARFQAFMEHLPAIMFIKDLSGRYVFGNPGWAQQFQESIGTADVQQFYGKTDFDLWPEPTARMIQAEDQKIIQTGVTYETNEEGHDFGGHVRNWLVRKFLIPNPEVPLIGGFILEVTEQKKAEKALRESEERFRQLAETARVVPWEWNCQECRYTYVGPQVAAVFGHSSHEWTVPDFWDRNVHPADLEKTLAYCREQIEIVDHYDVEYRFRDAQGRWRWIHDVVTVSRQNGQPEFLRGYMVDITARREIEEALRISESRLRSVTDHAPDIIVQIDREHRIRFISRVLPSFSVADALGVKAEDFLHSDDQEVASAEIERVFATGQAGEYVARLVHPTEGLMWFSCSVGPVLVAGKVESVIIISRDITAQKRTDLALRESEQRYRLLADHSSDMIARIDPDGVFAYVSPAAERITGYTPDELLGRNFEHLVPREEIPRIYQEIGGVVTEQREHIVTYRLIRKDGKIIWAESKGQPVLDPVTNQVTELIVNTRDVTERLEAARRLREREHHLAHAERLATMGQMASELAHEINQPLYAIANFADAGSSALEQPNPESAAELGNWLAQIAIQARRASDIVRRINHFVRKGDAEWADVLLNDCVREVIPLFEINARRDGVLLELELQPNLPMVSADRLLMEQVLTNLIRNGLEAIREANPSHKRLLIRTNFVDGQGVFVAVIDNGCGIPDTRFEQLFEPYFTSKRDGTGMGLSICRTTIEAHGGRIWAVNNHERGATFQFVIPAISAKSD